MPTKRKIDLQQQRDTKRRRKERDRQRTRNMTDDKMAHFRKIKAQQKRKERAKITENRSHAENQINYLPNIQLHEQNERSIQEKSQLQKNRHLRHRTHIANRTKYNASKEKYEDSFPQHYCGELDVICTNCNALYFHTQQSADHIFSQCCSKGKIIMQSIKVAPLIESLMTGTHKHSKNFKENIRSLNSSLAFASMGANITPPPGYGPYCFRINGEIYHRTASLHPSNEDNRKFAQLYILDKIKKISLHLCKPHLTSDCPLGRLNT